MMRRVEAERAEEEEELIAYIERDASLSSASRTHYVSKLRTLANLTAGASLAWIVNHAARVLGAVRARADRGGGVPAQTLHAYCASVLALLDRLPPRRRAAAGIRADARTDWAACARAASAATRRKYALHVASDAQRANFVSWEDLNAARRALQRDPDTPACCPALLLLSMLTLMPPMRTSDLGSLRVVRVNSDAALPSDEDDARRAGFGRGNHLVVGRTRAFLIVTEFKTAKRYAAIQAADEERRQGRERREREKRAGARFPAGTFAQDRLLRRHLPPRRLEGEEGYENEDEDGRLVSPVRCGFLPDDLFAVVARCVRANPRAWLFRDSRGRPFVKENSFNQMVLRELRRLFDGRRLTVNLVRHAAVLWLEREHPHDAPLHRHFQYWMMHSRATQRQYLLLRNMEDGDLTGVGGGGGGGGSRGRRTRAPPRPAPTSSSPTPARARPSTGGTA